MQFASWQCKIQQHGGEITSHRVAKGVWGHMGEHEVCQEPPKCFERGSLSQNDPSEPMVVSFSPECLFKGNRLKTSPAGLACQREREERGRLLPQKGSESAGHWFPSNSNYCLFALEIV